MKTIGIISLAGNVEQENVEKAKLNLENFGFRVKLSSNIYDKNRYLAGSDESKIKAFNEFLLDDEIDIIMSSRGGYGSIRLINKLDYELIKKHPKMIVGYSDITALLLMIYKNTRLMTYHGPMLVSDFVEPNIFTLKSFLGAINGDSLLIEPNKLYKKGESSGIIWGGNLSTVVSLCGLDFIPNEDFIFFAEDLNEPCYKIDKMFYQLFNIDKFRKNCKAIILGDFLDVNNEEWLDKLFTELALGLNIPVLKVSNITHEKEKLTIPIGTKCLIKASKILIN